jgi:CubicO group peptidase (beta-lactamase class C family)
MINNNTDCAIAIIKNGIIVESIFSPNVNKDTLFPVASLSKIITTIAIMQLNEKKIIDIYANINDFLDIKIENPNDKNFVITIKMLLQHNSGLNNAETTAFTISEKIENISLKNYIIENLETMKSNNNWFPPKNNNLPFWYSNFGFVILGYVVEYMTKMKFYEYVENFIFHPMNIRGYWFYENNININIIDSYHDGNILEKINYIEYPSHQLKISLDDLCKIMFIFINNDTAILSQETVDLIIPDNYKDGLGFWGKYQIFGENFDNNWTHGGNMKGVSSRFTIYKEFKSGIIILSNSNWNYYPIYNNLKKKCKNIL